MKKIALALLLGCAGTAIAKPVNHIIAWVNQDIITQAELEKEINKHEQKHRAAQTASPSAQEMREQVLETLVLRKLQLQHAEKAKITVEEPEVQHAIERLSQENHLSVPEFKSQVQAAGLNWDAFLEELKQDLILNQLHQQELLPKITVTAGEVQTWLITHTLPTGTAHYRLSHVLLPVSDTSPEAQKQAQTAAQNLKKTWASANNWEAPEQWENFAVQYSDLGWRTAEELPSILQGKESALQNGALIGPLHSDSGWHLVKVEQVDAPKIENPENFALQTLRKQKFEEELSKWLAQLKTHAYLRTAPKQ